MGFPCCLFLLTRLCEGLESRDSNQSRIPTLFFLVCYHVGGQGFYIIVKETSLYTDAEIVNGLINLDPAISAYVFYNRCYPLFKHLYSSYYTDCKTCLDLAHEIYILIMMPSTQSGKSKLQTFAFRSSFDTWLSVVSHNYCYAKFKKRIDTSAPIDFVLGDRFHGDSLSIGTDISSISKSDIETVLEMMPNERYRDIIRLIYLEGKDNDETAIQLGMKKSNLYNKHLLAKAQFEKVLKQEGLI